MSLESLIKWFNDRQGKVTYSMESRNGPSSYDCSSAVYYGLIQGGFLPPNHRIGNTDSLYGDLERSGWTRTNSPQRGSIFLWGIRGASGGGAGHTGVFIDNKNIIHCAYGYNGIHIDNHDWLWGINGKPSITYYTYSGQPYQGDTDQSVDIGSTIKLEKTYRVDDIQLIDGIWQIRNNELCTDGFTWGDNGIPAEPLIEVDSDGYRTADQSLDIGSEFKLPGKYTVLDLGAVNGRWLALIEWNGLKFWIDLETVTEIKADDIGTPVPSARPATPAEPKPEASAPLPDPIPELETPEPTPQPIPIEEDKPQKEPDMAFNEDQKQQLKIATERVQDIANMVAEGEAVQEIVSGVSKKTKLIVYIVGDTLIGLGLICAPIAIVAGWDDLDRIVALTGVFSTAGAFLLTMFGLYKSNKS